MWNGKGGPRKPDPSDAKLVAQAGPSTSTIADAGAVVEAENVPMSPTNEGQEASQSGADVQPSMAHDDASLKSTVTSNPNASSGRLLRSKPSSKVSKKEKGE